jgi:hypothetical protein
MMDIPRNDPCPCGSGKKYKKCCLLGMETGQMDPAKIPAWNEWMKTKIHDLNDPEWVQWFLNDCALGQRNKEEHEKSLPPPK